MKTTILSIFAGLLLVLCSACSPDKPPESQAASAPPPPPPEVVVYADTNIGGGIQLSAGFDSTRYNLKSVSYWAKAEWPMATQAAFTECHPVPLNQPVKACPDPVTEVGMNGVVDETGADGIRRFTLNVLCAVPKRHYLGRIRLVLTPK